jgi:hypothetical protein
MSQTHGNSVAPFRFLTPFPRRFSQGISEGLWVEKTVWKAERAWFLDQRKRRAKPGIEPLLTDLWPSLWTQISEGSKRVCSLGRRAGFSIPPEKGRQGVSMKLSSRRKGESGAVPPPRSRRIKSGVFSKSIGLSLSNILGGRFHRLPSMDDSERLNLQGRSFHSRVFYSCYLEENKGVLS